MQTFSALLDTLMAAPHDRKSAIERMIQDAFGCRKVVLALDMSGFTLMVQRDGILPYLCQIRRMHLLTRPIVIARQGQVVKNEADNLLAVFDDAGLAVRAALAMVAASQRVPADGLAPISFSIGLDSGDMLLINQVDCFGDAVNLAYKLGEDIARAHEILITQNVADLLADDPMLQLTPSMISVSGLDVMAYNVTAKPDALSNPL